MCLSKTRLEVGYSCIDVQFCFVFFLHCFIFFLFFPDQNIKHKIKEKVKECRVGVLLTPLRYSVRCFALFSYVWLGYCIGFFLCSYFSFFFFACLLFFFLLCFVLSPFSCLFYFVCLFSYSTFDWFVSYYSCVRF